MDRQIPTQMRPKQLAQSFSSLQLQSRPAGSERLSESCNGKITTDTTEDPELTNLGWLSYLTPQSLGGPMLDVDNIASNEEILGSSMNSSSTEHSDVSQNLTHSAETSCNVPVSPLGQDYHRFLEERKRSEGESRRFSQSSSVVMNPSSMICNSNSQQQYTKPPLSFGALICLAIESSPRRKLPVREIYMWIEGNFPYYKNAPGMSWKNSVRHNLSLSKAFVKIPRDLPGGKGCLWGINDDYRNSLIASFRRSGLSYPLIFPLGGVTNEDKPGDERSLPEYYSQAALEQQQHPQAMNNVTHQQIIQHALSHSSNQQSTSQQAFQQFQLFQSRQRQGQRFNHRRSINDGDESQQQTFMRDLRFFNQAIKRTQALMFKESLEADEEEEDEGEERQDEEERPDEVADLEEIPLDSHGLTSEQIAELNHLARRGRRRKTRNIRHMTPCPSLDHDYCKVKLCTEDLYESETDEEAEEVPNRSVTTVRRPRPLPTTSALSAARRRLQERSARRPAIAQRQLAWYGHRRPSFHARTPFGAGGRSHQTGRCHPVPAPEAWHEAMTRAQSNTAIPTRRRRPGRPPKNRSATEETAPARRIKTLTPQSFSRKRARQSDTRRETDSGSLADDEEVDDALTEPMIDEADSAAMAREVEENGDASQAELNIDDIEAADILTRLKHHPTNFVNNGMYVQSGVYYQMEAPVAATATVNQGEAITEEEGRNRLIDEEQGGRDCARSPENIPPTAGDLKPNIPKRRGRRPRSDTSKIESLAKANVGKSTPLTPAKRPQHDHNEANVCSRSGLPKRQAAVNAPAVWKRKKMSK